MTNLLEETQEAIGNSGYGSPEIATDLVIRFSDGRSMWRAEYDGSEWWDFDTINNTVYDLFKAKPLRNVKGRLWKLL